MALVHCLPTNGGQGLAVAATTEVSIHQSDRDSQYCSHNYQKILRQHRFQASMSGTRICYKFKQIRASGLNALGDYSKAQNAAVETFLKTIKADLT